MKFMSVAGIGSSGTWEYSDSLIWSRRTAFRSHRIKARWARCSNRLDSNTASLTSPRRSYLSFNCRFRPSIWALRRISRSASAHKSTRSAKVYEEWHKWASSKVSCEGWHKQPLIPPRVHRYVPSRLSKPRKFISRAWRRN